MGNSAIKQNNRHKRNAQIANILFAFHVKKAIQESQYGFQASNPIYIDLQFKDSDLLNKFSLCSFSMIDSSARHNIIINFNRILASESSPQLAETILSYLSKKIEIELNEAYMVDPLCRQYQESQFVQTQFDKVAEEVSKCFLEIITEITKFTTNELELLQEGCNLFHYYIKPQVLVEFKKIRLNIQQQVAHIYGNINHNLYSLIKSLNQALIDIAKYNVVNQEIRKLNAQDYLSLVQIPATQKMLGFESYHQQNQLFIVFKELLQPQISKDFMEIQAQIFDISGKKQNIQPIDGYYSNWRQNWITSPDESSGSQNANQRLPIENDHEVRQLQTTATQLTIKKVAQVLPLNNHSNGKYFSDLQISQDHKVFNEKSFSLNISRDAAHEQIEPFCH